MAVPDTNRFSLQEVKAELNSSSNDLVSFFAEANSNGFDPAYDGARNQLLNFRNYYHPTSGVITRIFMTAIPAETREDPCVTDLGAALRYHYFTGAYRLVLNEVIYNDPSALNPFNGRDKWWRSGCGDDTCQINTVGAIIAVHECALR